MSSGNRTVLYVISTICVACFRLRCTFPRPTECVFLPLSLYPLLLLLLLLLQSSCRLSGKMHNFLSPGLRPTLPPDDLWHRRSRRGADGVRVRVSACVCAHILCWAPHVETTPHVLHVCACILCVRFVSFVPAGIISSTATRTASNSTVLNGNFAFSRTIAFRGGITVHETANVPAGNVPNTLPGQMLTTKWENVHTLKTHLMAKNPLWRAVLFGTQYRVFLWSWRMEQPKQNMHVFDCSWMQVQALSERICICSRSACAILICYVPQTIRWLTTSDAGITYKSTQINIHTHTQTMGEGAPGNIRIIEKQKTQYLRSAGWVDFKRQQQRQSFEACQQKLLRKYSRKWDTNEAADWLESESGPRQVCRHAATHCAPQQGHAFELVRIGYGVEWCRWCGARQCA